MNWMLSFSINKVIIQNSWYLENSDLNCLDYLHEVHLFWDNKMNEFLIRKKNVLMRDVEINWKTGNF